MNVLTDFWIHVVGSAVGLLVLGALWWIPKRLVEEVTHHAQLVPPKGITEAEWKDAVSMPLQAGGLIGSLERLLFFGAVIWAGGQAGGIAIGAWLAFKVASKWETWSHIAQVPETLVPDSPPLPQLKARIAWASHVFARFIVGTLSNVVVAGIAAGVGRIIFLYSKDVISAVCVHS